MIENLDDKLLSPFLALEGDNATSNHKEHVSSIPESWSVTPGETQPSGYRDVAFAALFIAHLIAIFSLAWGSLDYEVPYTSIALHFSGILWLCLTTGAIAFGISTAALHLLTRHAEQLIQLTLGGQVIVSGLLFFWFFLRGFWLGVFLTSGTGLLGLLYARAVWHRVPYSAANLRFALAAVQRNGGLLLVACCMAGVWLLWNIVWLRAWLGVYVRHAECNRDAAEGDTCISHTNGFIIMAFLFSYMWTTAVTRNILRVTVAGVTGAFCVTPGDGDSFQSPCIADSWHRACTYSLGSICLGSLLTSVLQLMHQFFQVTRRQFLASGHANICLSAMECLAGFLERIVEYFNKWGYCYIGLYGYDYLTASQTVLQLFRDRGWTALLTDRMVQRTLVLASIVVGLLTGAIGLLLAKLWPSWWLVFPQKLAFVGPAILGAFLASLLLTSVVESAVDTVIIAFAERPSDLERNHPVLYHQMATAWRMVYPDEFRL